MTWCLRRAAAGTAALCVAFSLGLASAGPARADDAQIARGKYLVSLGGCHDCHTPGYFLGKPDFEHALSGSEVGFLIPDVGVFHGRNLTPDAETGIGSWSADDIVKAIRTGERPDGRILAPIMPWKNLAVLTDEDAYAIAAYLKSLPPVKNAVPGPFGPEEKPTGYVMAIQPPQQ